jgi:hypothetical protein
MIEEKFMLAAINIRKTYLKLTSNLDFYKNRAEQTLEKLQTALSQIEGIENEIKDLKKKKDQKKDTNITNKVFLLLNEIEEEGNKIEKFVEPLNKEIEKLAVEEQELYRLIVEKHPELSEDQIVEAVRLRLIKENLS